MSRLVKKQDSSITKEDIKEWIKQIGAVNIKPRGVFAWEQGQAIAIDKKDYRINDKSVYKNPIPKGCKIYQFGSFECIAINYKTAQRKFNKYMLNKIKL